MLWFFGNIFHVTDKHHSKTTAEVTLVPMGTIVLQVVKQTYFMQQKLMYL